MTARLGNSGAARTFPVRRVGNGPEHAFFGYYNKTNWDPSGRYLLAQRVPMRTKDLDGTEVAEIGYFDLNNGDHFEVVDTTTTWNWQMGAQLQWLGGGGRRIIYNDRNPVVSSDSEFNRGFRSTIRDLDTGGVRHLPQPVYSVAPDGRWAVVVNYSRLLKTHRTIGYSQVGPESGIALCPADDGIMRMDLATGQVRPIVTLEQLSQFYPRKSMQRAVHWISHAEINPPSSRILFLHRWTERVEDEFCFLHRLISCNPDGRDMRLLECSDHPLPQLEVDFDPDSVGTFDYEKSEYQISHPLWKDDRHIIVWGPHEGSIAYHLYDDANGSVEAIGRDVLTENGHMTYSPDGRWLLSDTYPDAETHIRHLFVWDVENKARIDLGAFRTDPDLGKHNRCDLHPRWSPDGRTICIDSIHEGPRGLYLVDVSSLGRSAAN